MEKPVSASDAHYQDEQCEYLWGDPRVTDRRVKGKLVMTTGGIRFVYKKSSIAYARTSIRSVRYQVDTGGNRSYQLIFKVEDLEGVYPSGFDVEFEFRNDYYAKVFGKRFESAFGLPFSVGKE
ncbi:MAG: hypothetical protein AABZ47_18580 [Planctomycetota bacterium]